MDRSFFIFFIFLSNSRLIRFSATTHLEILQSLVLSPSCPKPVLALCSPNIASLLNEKKRQPPIPASFNIAAVRQVLADAIGMKGGGKFQVKKKKKVTKKITNSEIYAQTRWGWIFRSGRSRTNKFNRPSRLPLLWLDHRNLHIWMSGDALRLFRPSSFSNSSGQNS